MSRCSWSSFNDVFTVILFVLSCGHVLLRSCDYWLIWVVAAILAVEVTEPFLQHLDLMAQCITHTIALVVVVSPYCRRLMLRMIVILFLLSS